MWIPGYGKQFSTVDGEYPFSAFLDTFYAKVVCLR